MTLPVKNATLSMLFNYITKGIMKMNLKRIISGALAAIAAISLSACGSTPKTEEKQAGIGDNYVLKVGEMM